MDNSGENTGKVDLRVSIAKKICVVAILIIAGAFISYLATNNHSSSAPAVNPYEVSLAQIDKNVQSGSPIIDVRTPEEYAAQHAKGAINLPLANIQTGKIPTAAKNTIVYVYCQSGVRAAQAKILLGQDGYQHVISLGGIGNWIVLGGQVTSSSQDKCIGSDRSKC